ncbi:hypothetical protein ACVNPS_04485 [Candidatus Bipolaricaulota sp. J31]
MKRAFVFAAMLAVVMGSLGYGFGDSCCPPPDEPCCYTSFWMGDPVCFKLVVPFSFFCCCGDKELIVSWRIEALDGTLVYQHTYTTPISPGTEIRWDQVDMAGQQVPAGFYNIVITTTEDEYRTAIKIVEKSPCCWTILRSKPCGISFCKPYIKVYKCPSCCEPACCLPLPCLGCCNVTLFFGCCSDD